MTSLLPQIEAFLAAHPSGILVVTGPTASGKSSLAITLAKRFNGEIISADSVQVYKKMDIGSNKVSLKERKEVPHHLIDICNPDETFTMGDYKRAAEIAIEDILKCKKTPILCGGTGLFLNAITQNYQLPKAPPSPVLRAELENFLEKEGPEALYQKLKELDPEGAVKVHPNNLRYVLRAIEILLQTEAPLNPKTAQAKYPSFRIAIDWPRKELYQKIDQRVEELLDLGLLNEIKTLLAEGYDLSLPSMQAIGYKEYIPYLKGEATLEECKSLHKQFTRNYAKRQLTWFRKDKELHWISPSIAIEIDSAHAQ